MNDLIDLKLNTANSLMDDAVYTINELAKAFSVTGNSLVAETLWRCRDQIQSAQDEVSSAKDMSGRKDEPSFDTSKPFKGSIENWSKMECNGGLGYFILGTFLDHPEFGKKYTNTSWVEKHDENTGYIETRNSRYQLIGQEKKIVHYMKGGGIGPY